MAITLAVGFHNSLYRTTIQAVISTRDPLYLYTIKIIK